MADCPNCGRPTLRTKDWACQWCGYPLISRAFNTIDKTFKELQEERRLTARSTEPDIETEPEVVTEPEIETEAEIAVEPELPPSPKSVERPAPQPVPKPQPEYKPISPVRPVASYEPESSPISHSEPVYQPKEPAPRQQTTPAYRPEPEPEPQPNPVYRAEPEPDMEPREKVSPAPRPEPEIVAAPEPPPAPPIKLEEIHDGMEITTNQMDALYKADSTGANSEFNGKTLVLKGTVEKVFVREHLEIRYMILGGVSRKTTWSVRCTFNKQESLKLSQLNEGDVVRLQGRYEGYSKNIMLKDCVLQ